MNYIKNYETYNNNKLNELIVKYFNEYSEEIIEIIDTYENVKDAKNILEKISFIIESPGDVETIEIDGEERFHYIDMKDDKKRTIIYDLYEEKFKINTKKHLM